MVNTRPRNQHIISKGYQLNFCNPEGKIFVYNMQGCKWFTSCPSKQFREKDFQSLFNYEGLNPYILEKEFGKVEGVAIEVIRGIIKNKKLPDKEQFSYVVNLMGLFGARNAIRKNQLIQMGQQKFLRVSDFVTEDEARYNNLMEKMEEEGKIDKRIPYKKAKKFIKGRKFKIEQDSDEIVMKMVEDAVNLVDFLEFKYWLIVEAKNSEFLSSNHPLNMIKLKNVNDFAVMDCIFTFPLSSHIALIGSFFKLPSYRLIDDDIVDGINYCTAYKATKLFAMEEAPLPSKESMVYLQNFYYNVINKSL